MRAVMYALRRYSFVSVFYSMLSTSFAMVNL